jgi:hypothetical protein
MPHLVVGTDRDKLASANISVFPVTNDLNAQVSAALFDWRPVMLG